MNRGSGKKLWAFTAFVAALGIYVTLDSRLVKGADSYAGFDSALENFGDAFNELSVSYFKELKPEDLTDKAIEGMLSDPHPRVREAALDQMIVINHSSAAADPLLDGPLRLKAAKLRFPSLIESESTTTICSLCHDPNPALRKVIANHLESVDWFDWKDVYTAVKDSNDSLLLPRLLRSRREPRADEIRFELLQKGEDDSRARVLENLHGRKISQPISDLLPSLAEDPNPLIAQAATSLIADSKIMETGI